MKIVFFGSSKYSIISANQVHKKYPVSLVVTLSDRHSFSQILVSPVKKFAKEFSIPFITADKLTDDVIEKIAHVHPDFLLVADYGLLLPKKLLDLPKKAPLNIHHSLLPKYRGPSPAPSAILNGEKVSGVTVMTMSEKMDTGNILAQKEYTLTQNETTDSLLTKLNQLGGNLTAEVLENFDTYYKNRKTQDASQATYTKQITKHDGFIDLSKVESLSSLEIGNWKLEIARKVRAYFPWPGVWFKWQRAKGKELLVKLLPASSHPELVSGSSKILLQTEGKKPMTIKDFINGYPEGKTLIQKLGL